MNRQASVRAATTDVAHRLGQPGEFRLTLLGGFSLEQRDRAITLPLGAQRLVAFLALQLRPLLRSYVAGMLWPDCTEERSSASLRSTLWRMRLPGPPLVLATGSHLALADWVVVDVREAVLKARRLVDSSEAAADLDPTTLTGELLPGWADDDWLLVERERLRQLCLHGLEAMCERLLALGRYGDAIEAGLAAVRGEPLRESAHRVLIMVYLAEGNFGEALRQYRWYTRILAEELGAVPSPRIEHLVRGLHRAV